MQSNRSNTLRKEYLAKIILIGIFLGAFALFTGWMFIFGPGLAMFNLSWIDLALLGFSTYRLGRLIAYDRVMEPFRQFFTVTVPDSTGAGDTVDPKGEGFQNALGQLICCPICAGTWVAALLTYTLYLFPGPAHVFLTMTAAIGIAELLGALSEALSWSGQYARTMSGAKMLERQEQVRSQERTQSGYDAARRPFREEDQAAQAAPHAQDEVVETYREYR